VGDDLKREIKRQALSRKISVKELVNEALRVGLRALARPSPRRRARIPVHHMGQPSQVNLDRALGLAWGLEDEEIGRDETSGLA